MGKFLVLPDKQYIKHAISINQIGSVEEYFSQEKGCQLGAMIYLKDFKEPLYTITPFDDLVAMLNCGVVSYGKHNEGGSSSYEFLAFTEVDPCTRWIIRTDEIAKIDGSGERCIIYLVYDNRVEMSGIRNKHSLIVAQAYFDEFVEFLPHDDLSDDKSGDSLSEITIL